MFRKTKKDTAAFGVDTPVVQKKMPPTIISQDVNLLGTLVSEGTIDFDGKIDGNIRCKILNIRVNGVVHGEVAADEVYIFGRVVGTVQAKSVTLHSSAYVDGIIMHETVTIEDGATIDGKLKKTNKVEESTAQFDYEPVEPISPSKLMENIRLIASN